MLFLGISGLEHDTSAALVDRQGHIAAVEEEKLSRSAAPNGIPHLAIARCLRQVGAQGRDLSLTVVACRLKRAWLREGNLKLRMLLATHSGLLFRRATQSSLLWRLDQLRALRRLFGSNTPFSSFEHHLCHAASAFYPAEFDRALVLTLDESGDMWSGLLALGQGSDLRILRPIQFPNSLGWFYSRVTALLGFRPGRDEHKVQWLSKEGSPEFLPVFRRLFSKNSEGLPVVNRSCFGEDGAVVSAAFSTEICRDLQISASPPPGDSLLGANIARSAQDFLEETVSDLVELFRRKTGAEYLCLAGGVFLNVLLVRALETRTGFAKVFVQPASGNAGSALGAAYLARRSLGSSQREPLSHLYLGPKFEEAEIKDVLDNCKTVYRYLPSEKELIDETVRLLQGGKVVAWYQGRLEFGHRALGNRSILASPFSPFVTENLNKYVKHREDFHPFGLSVPAERASEFFDCTDNCRFMSSVGRLKAGIRDLERFAFNRDAVRVHTVDRRVNARFSALLCKFGEISPCPVLINTSFNLFGEPLVCDPREAVRSFYCSGIDALVLGNFLVVKS